MFKNKVLMITGGTGSFGNVVLNRFLQTDIKEIRIFSRDEKKQEEMRIKFNSKKLKFYIGDVREAEGLSQALKGVDYVFHAAALKQVPSCEFYPMEAIKTNIIGTENLINAALKNQVKRVVILSTDKAVYPINAMGLTKALSEKIMIARSRALNESDTIFCATRYGNVMGSRGSVIPLFMEQIFEEKKLTITDPEMTRFMMSLEESVDLVLHAFKYGNQGDIFVQKAPACTVENLATALIEIFTPKNKQFNIIGTRHGEKLYETLVSREEIAKAVDMGRYFRVPSDNRDLNYGSYFNSGEMAISSVNDYTSHNTVRLSISETKDLLLQQDFIRRAIND